MRLRHKDMPILTIVLFLFFFASAGTSYGPESLCLSVCVRHKWVFYRIDWTDQASFGTEVSFDLSYTVLQGNSGTSKVTVSGTSLWNFAPNPGL